MVGKHVHDQGGMVEGTCPGLIEGNQYMFRIKAVNIGTTILILISSSTVSNYIWTIFSKGSSKKVNFFSSPAKRAIFFAKYCNKLVKK